MNLKKVSDIAFYEVKVMGKVIADKILACISRG